MASNICWPCRRGQHNGCAGFVTLHLQCDCTHDTVAPVPNSAIGDSLGLEPTEPDSRTVTRRYKDDQSVTDPQSTGRKRAASLYPLIDGNGNRLPCDLAGKKDALPNFMKVQIDGCGVRQGTLPGKAQSRHHHDYNVMNNDRDNIGLLCHSCHNLIHAKNDPHKAEIYQTVYGFLPDTQDLKHANKALKSGVVGGGVIQSKEEVGINESDQ